MDSLVAHTSVGVRERNYGEMLIFELTNKERITMTQSRTAVKNIVLVHGGFVDGSGWEGVYNALKRDGYTIAIVQNPTISLADDEISADTFETLGSLVALVDSKLAA